MLPLGALTLFFHFFVILGNEIKKKFKANKRIITKKKPNKINQKRSLLIQALVIFFLFDLAIISVISFANDDSSNIQKANKILNKCKPFDISLKKNNVIIRIDDIQAIGWHDISKQMIEDSMRLNVPLSLGIIPKELEENQELINILNENSCNIDFGLHGWDNSYDGGAEFSNIDEQEASRRLNLGINVLKKEFNINPLLFIPPNNLISNEAMNAISKTNIKIISSEGENFYDYTASTYDFFNKHMINNQDIIKQCQDDFSKDKTCIIMIHPQDYADINGNLDKKKYRRYLHLIRALHNQNASFIKFSDLYYNEKSKNDKQLLTINLN